MGSVSSKGDVPVTAEKKPSVCFNIKEFNGCICVLKIEKSC